MSPMTSRTGPKGRSETTFVAGAEAVTVTEAVTVAVTVTVAVAEVQFRMQIWDKISCLTGYMSFAILKGAFDVVNTCGKKISY